MQLQRSRSTIAKLFLYAAIVQGAVASGITFVGAFGDQMGLLPVAVSRVIAGGEAGSWFTVGYLTYLIVGVVSTAVTSLFYFFIEIVEGKSYKGLNKALSWAHFILGNAGVAGAAFLAMAGGYLGGAAAQPKQFGGQGWTNLQVHQNILQYYPTPIAIFLSLGLIGFFLGGLGYLLTMRSKD